MAMNENAQNLGLNAKTAFDQSQLLNKEEKSKALLNIKDELIKRKLEIFEENEKDLKVSILIIYVWLFILNINRW